MTRKNPKPENITEEICEKEAEKNRLQKQNFAELASKFAEFGEKIRFSQGLKIVIKPDKLP